MLTWTELPNKYGTTMTAHSGTWPELLERIRTIGTFPSKDKCPWVKLATFGAFRSPKGSLRNNDNTQAVYGIEGDYDGEVITMAQAAHLLESYGIRAALYPSPSNTAQKPRWRVIAPLAKQHTPAERAGLVARLNGALNGILAGESFTLSQGYFFGATPTNDYRVIVTFDDPEEGTCIDDLDELDEIAIGKTLDAATPSTLTATIAPAYADSAVVRDLRSALTSMRADDRVLWVAVGHALKTLGEQGRSLWLEWSQSSDKYDAQDAATRWETFNPSSTGYQSVFAKAQAAGWLNPGSAHRSTPIDISGILPKAPEIEHIDPDTGEIIQGVDSEQGGQLIEPDDDTGRMRLVSIADVLTNPQPPHPFIWGPYIPAEANTLLSGHGGTGKSGFVLQLSAHVAMGLDFLGFPVRQAKTLFFSAEDAASILRLRVADICRNHDLDPVELSENLHVMDATDAAVLWQSEGPRKPGEATANYAALQQYINDHEIGFVAVDNASDTFGADRFDKSQVTQFVRALVRLVKKRGGGSLLLSHVNRSTAAPKLGNKSAGGESYADSVAWHNSSRSRLFLAGDDSGEGLTFEHEKSNYGKKETRVLTLRRLEGCGVEVVEPAGAGNPAQAYLDEMKLTPVLSMMDEFYKRGEWIQPVVTAHTNAYKMLAGETGFPKGLKKPELFKLLRDAERRNLIHREVYTNASRRDTERWKVGAAPSAPSAPSGPLEGTSAESAKGRASAPSCVGGMGDCVRADEGAQEGAPIYGPPPASIEEGALSGMNTGAEAINQSEISGDLQ